MKIARITIFKTCNVLIAGLLTLLGFACVTDPRAEYGTPSAKFIVNGKVTSAETNQAIEGVKVILQAATTTTDSEGNFQVSDPSAFPTDQEYLVKFIDMDQEVNGHFNDLDTIVEFIEPVFTKGDGHWYQGETRKDLDIQLTPKK